MKIDCNLLPPAFSYSWHKSELTHAYIKTISAALSLLNQEQIIIKVYVREIEHQLFRLHSRSREVLLLDIIISLLCLPFTWLKVFTCAFDFEFDLKTRAVKEKSSILKAGIIFFCKSKWRILCLLWIYENGNIFWIWQKSGDNQLPVFPKHS